MSFDPIGPGTAAWEAFDNAWEAYQDAPRGQHNSRNKAYKRYLNFRQYMIAQLRKHGAAPDVVRGWADALAARRREAFPA